VNPPTSEASPIAAAPRPEPAAAPVPPPGPTVVTAEEQDSGEERDPPAPAPEPDETARPRPPAPVHVAYARTGSEPDVLSPPAPRGGPRRPARSPFWAAVRSHLWLVTIVLVVVGAAGAAYWGLRVHQRIGGTTLEREIEGREHATTVRCIEQQPNGAVWACGLVYSAESVCLIADVNPAGDWKTKPGVDLCNHKSELSSLLPATITPAAVAADLDSQHGLAGTTCAKVPAHKVRWACTGPAASGSPCVLVRVVPWTPWTTTPSGACAHIPALQRALRKAH